MGLPSGIGCSESREGSVEAHDAFFQLVFGSDFFQFLVDFGRIFGAKTEPKIDFFEFFLMFFSIVISASIFFNFFVFFSNPNLDFCAHSQCFVMIFTKSTFSKK